MRGSRFSEPPSIQHFPAKFPDCSFGPSPQPATYAANLHTYRNYYLLERLLLLLLHFTFFLFLLHPVHWRAAVTLHFRCPLGLQFLAAFTFREMHLIPGIYLPSSRAVKLITSHKHRPSFNPTELAAPAGWVEAEKMPCNWRSVHHQLHRRR